MFTKYSLTFSFLFTLFFIPNHNIDGNKIKLYDSTQINITFLIIKDFIGYARIGEGNKKVLDLVEKNLDKWGGVCGKVNNGQNNIVRIRDPRIVPKYFQLIPCNKAIIHAE